MELRPQEAEERAANERMDKQARASLGMLQLCKSMAYCWLVGNGGMRYPI